MSDQNKQSSLDYQGMNDDDMVEIHTQLGREKHEPTEGS